jgi:hypothetical protein
VRPFAVAKNLDPLGDLGNGLGAGREASLVDQFSAKFLAAQ